MKRLACLAIGMAILPLACAKTSPESAPVSTQSAPIVQAPVPSARMPRPGLAERRMDRGGGTAEMLLQAARELELKDGQKPSIDTVQQLLTGDRQGPMSEVKEYQTALAAGVRAGKIETAKLAPLQASVDKAMQARKDKDAAALNALHAALEPAQRKAAVASVRAKQTEREARMQGRKPEGVKPSAADYSKRHLERMTKELDLDAAQQKSVEALMSKEASPAPNAMDSMREEMKKRTEAVLTAFEADTFDATKLDLSPMPAKKPGDAADKNVAFLTKILPILKPEQREKLAARMEKPMGRGPRAGMQNHPGLFDDAESEENPRGAH